MNFARIVGTGSYLPEKIMSNHELEQRIDTTAQWIYERTGIEQRHIAAPSETTTDLAEAAARPALEAANIAITDIDLIIVATTTPDHVFPSVATQLQDLVLELHVTLEFPFLNVVFSFLCHLNQNF